MLPEDMFKELNKDVRVGNLEVRQVRNKFIATYYKEKLAGIGNTEMEALQRVRDALDVRLAELKANEKKIKKWFRK